MDVPLSSSPSIFGYAFPTITSRSSSGYGRGLKNKPLKTLKTVVFAPMASASTSIVTAAYAGRLASAGSVARISCRSALTIRYPVGASLASRIREIASPVSGATCAYPMLAPAAAWRARRLSSEDAPFVELLLPCRALPGRARE